MKKRLTDHLTDCEECSRDGVTPESLAALESALRVEDPPADDRLVARTLMAAGPLLKSRARFAYRRRVAMALAAALVPLPVVVIYSRWLFGLMHSGLELLFPSGVADVLVGGYAICLLLVISLTFAAIPILADRKSFAEVTS
jgi:hypothetical protein